MITLNDLTNFELYCLAYFWGQPTSYYVWTTRGHLLYMCNEDKITIYKPDEESIKKLKREKLLSSCEDLLTDSTVFYMIHFSIHPSVYRFSHTVKFLEIAVGALVKVQPLLKFKTQKKTLSKLTKDIEKYVSIVERIGYFQKLARNGDDNEASIKLTSLIATGDENFHSKLKPPKWVKKIAEEQKATKL